MLLQIEILIKKNGISHKRKKMKLTIDLRSILSMKIVIIERNNLAEAICPILKRLFSIAAANGTLRSKQQANSSTDALQ